MSKPLRRNSVRRYLSVDCGGTKTAFLLCEETGRAAASCVLGPGNYLVNGMEEVLGVLKAGVEKVCAQAGIEQSDISHCFIALAGFKDIPEDVPEITGIVREAFPLMPISLGNDTENALAGSLLGKVGIHIIAGTGTIGLGYDEQEQYIRSGGWHHLFGGDEGSGYWIGCQMLQRFTKQADGREEKSALYEYLMKKYSLGCPENILKLVIDQWKGERDKIAGLSRDAFELAKLGDPNVLAVFRGAGRELAAIIRSIYQRGSFGSPILISYSGGVFKAMPYLREAMEEELRDIPHTFTEPQLQPVEGGILLACKADGNAIETDMVRHLKEWQSEAAQE